MNLLSKYLWTPEAILESLASSSSALVPKILDTNVRVPPRILPTASGSSKKLKGFSDLRTFLCCTHTTQEITVRNSSVFCQPRHWNSAYPWAFIWALVAFIPQQRRSPILVYLFSRVRNVTSFSFSASEKLLRHATIAAASASAKKQNGRPKAPVCTNQKRID